MAEASARRGGGARARTHQVVRDRARRLAREAARASPPTQPAQGRVRADRAGRGRGPTPPSRRPPPVREAVENLRRRRPRSWPPTSGAPRKALRREAASGTACAGLARRRGKAGRVRPIPKPCQRARRRPADLLVLGAEPGGASQGPDRRGKSPSRYRRRGDRLGKSACPKRRDPTRAATSRGPYLALLPVGFAVPVCYRTRGALLPHHFTLATHSGEAVGGIFLLHFPSARAAQALPGTVPGGARTFLGCLPRKPDCLADSAARMCRAGNEDPAAGPR